MSRASVSASHCALTAARAIPSLASKCSRDSGFASHPPTPRTCAKNWVPRRLVFNVTAAPQHGIVRCRCCAFVSRKAFQEAASCRNASTGPVGDWQRNGMILNLRSRCVPVQRIDSVNPVVDWAIPCAAAARTRNPTRFPCAACLHGSCIRRTFRVTIDTFLKLYSSALITSGPVEYSPCTS